MSRCKEFYDKWERDPNWCEKYNKVVMNMEAAFDQANSKGINAFETIRNGRMRKAIMEMYPRYKQVFEELKQKPTEEQKIEYLNTLPQIGKKEKFHLARNLGINCVKPDIHMNRLASSFGFSTPLEMCKKLQEYTNERLGVIDVILWRYCNLTGYYQAELRQQQHQKECEQ